MSKVFYVGDALPSTIGPIERVVKIFDQLVIGSNWCVPMGSTFLVDAGRLWSAECSTGQAMSVCFTSVPACYEVTFTI